MKKSLLFIIPSLSSGGAEKSLITLLELLDYNKYDVDLFLFRKEGLFLPNVPEQVNIIDGGEKYKAFDGAASDYIKKQLFRLRFDKVVSRIKYSKAIKKNDRRAMWDYLRKLLVNPTKHYDAAIGYLEGNANYFCVDCVNADVKIGYVHNDYSKLGMSVKFDTPFFTQLNSIVSVSAECTEVLKKKFPDFEEKIFTVENISSPGVLKKFAYKTPEEYEGVNSKLLLTVGRFSPQKGYDIAVEAARIMNENGVDFKWFSIGKGVLKSEIEAKINEYGLQDRFILLGERANPYPYIDCCDIYVQPSKFEGKSIAVDEAKCFAKPIVATKFSTVYDQLEDNKTALLAEIDAQSVAQKITQLINDTELCEALSNTLRHTHTGNEEELEKFYALLEG